MAASSGERQPDLRGYAAGETVRGRVAINGRPSGGSAIYSARSRVIPAPRTEGPSTYLSRVPDQAVRPVVHRQLWSVIARRWTLLVLVTVACVAGSVAYILLGPPHYQSSAQVLVTPAAPDPTLNGLKLISGSEPTRTVQTAVALLDTHAAAVRTAERLGSPYTATSVEQAVTIEPRGQSYIVSVIADAGTPLAATLLADTFAQSALDLRNEDVKAQAARLAQSVTSSIGPAHAPTDTEVAQLARLNLLASTGDPTVSLAETAPIPTARAGIPAPFVVLLAFGFGLVLAVAIAMAWDAVQSPRNSFVR